MTIEQTSAIGNALQAIAENTRATRVTNALLLAQSMKLDIADPVNGEKVLRYLRNVERQIGRAASD